MKQKTLNRIYPLDLAAFFALQDVQSEVYYRSRDLLEAQERVTNWKDWRKVDKALGLMAHIQTMISTALEDAGITTNDPCRNGFPLLIELRRDTAGVWRYLPVQRPVKFPINGG